MVSVGFARCAHRNPLQGAELYMGKVSASRVNQIAKSYGATPLAAYTLDNVYCGVLLPLDLRIHPMKHAPVSMGARAS